LNFTKRTKCLLRQGNHRFATALISPQQVEYSQSGVIVTVKSVHKRMLVCGLIEICADLERSRRWEIITKIISGAEIYAGSPVCLDLVVRDDLNGSSWLGFKQTQQIEQTYGSSKSKDSW
jgi:hypothetical protein